MVRIDTGRNVGIEVFPGNTGGMTVNHSSPGKVNFTEDTDISPEYIREIHYLPQPDAIPPPEKLANILGAKASSGGFKMGRRYTGRSHQKKLQG
jgi:hypothetical protein